MNAIYGFSERLSKPNLSEEKRSSYISIIQSSSNNLLSIVTDILTISSIVTKQEKINISKVCINKVIGDILPEFHKTALNKNLTLNVNMELSDLESEVFTDSVKISYILTHLITNALKFSETGIIVVGYKLKKDDEYTEMEFFVKDSGIGIKPELHEKIFEPFRQGEASKQIEYGGTGLGLSIAKGFVELLGGKIWVQSEHLKGSTFYFTIPYKTEIQNR
jgi:signal transduction histidine kinase